MKKNQISKTYLYAGEQAFRIASQKIERVLPYYGYAEALSFGVEPSKKKEIYSRLTESLITDQILTVNQANEWSVYIDILLSNGEDISDVCAVSSEPEALDESIINTVDEIFKKI